MVFVFFAGDSHSSRAVSLVNETLLLLMNELNQSTIDSSWKQERCFGFLCSPALKILLIFLQLVSVVWKLFSFVWVFYMFQVTFCPNTLKRENN